MITFSCPKCGKAFQVHDSAIGQHGWCRGCGAIIRVPASSDASETDILDIQLEPQVQALLRHMTQQIKRHRKHEKEMQATIDALRTSGDALTSQQRVLQKAEKLSRNLENASTHLDEERQAVRNELCEVLQALRELLKNASEHPPDHSPLTPHEEMDALQTELHLERSQHAQTKVRLEELDRQCAAAAQDSENRRDELARMEQRLDKAEERAAKLASRCGTLEEQTAALRRERDEAQRRLEDRTAAAEETETVAARLEEKESVIQRLSEELRAAIESKGELDSVCRLRLDEIALLSAEVSALTQSAEVDIAELRAELHAEQEAHALAERMLAETQEELRELRRIVDASRETVAEKAALEREMALLRDSLEKREAALDDRLAQLGEITGQLQDARERSHPLETELAPAPDPHSHVPEQGDHEHAQAPESEEPAPVVPGLKSGPFSRRFVSPSERSDGDQGITLMPEVLDDDYDSREMLDTLMRFLDPEDAKE